MRIWYFHYDKTKSDAERFPHGRLISVKDGQIVDETPDKILVIRVEG